MADKPHFNKGVIRGQIIELHPRKTQGKQKPYGELKVFCSSVEYGDITVRVRFWGSQLSELIKAYKAAPEMKYHLQGHIGLIENRGEHLWAFNAYTFKPWVPSPGKDEARASFIIMGTCSANFESFELHHVRPHATFPVDHLFKFAPPRLDSNATPPDLVTVYGHFMDPDHKYGGMGDVIPMIEKVTIRERRSS